MNSFVTSRFENFFNENAGSLIVFVLEQLKTICFQHIYQWNKLE